MVVRERVLGSVSSERAMVGVRPSDLLHSRHDKIGEVVMSIAQRHHVVLHLLATVSLAHQRLLHT